MAEPDGSKLAEQATAKADLSYSYWAANSVKAGASTVDPANAPKKLSEEEAAALQRSASGKGTSTSAWNAAGTFEERDVSEWARGAAKAALEGVTGGGARVTGVTSVTGSAHIWFIRGSKRAGFELDAALAWAVGDGDDQITGDLKLEGVTPDDLDDVEPAAVSITNKKAGRGDAEAAATREARRLAGPLREALRGWYENELKQR